MNRWIAFDPATADAVRQYSNDAALREQLDGTSALSVALREERPTVLVMPAPDGRATLARITRPQPAVITSIAETRLRGPNIHYAATGFLGLDDAVVLDEPPAKPKKWWEKILDG